MAASYQDLKIYELYGDNDPQYPVVISVPHAGRVFPSTFWNMTNLTEQALRGNEDCYMDEMLMPLANKGIPILSMNIARAFIDVNRDQIELDDHMFEDYPADRVIFENSRCRSGYGLIHRVTADSKPIYKGLLSYQEVQQRIKDIYAVYHQALRKMVNDCAEKFGYCFLIDCHSMPSKICSIMQDDAKIDVCLGDLFGQSCPEVLSASLKSALEQKGYEVLKNVPYSGAYTTFHYCEPKQKKYTIQLEINRALYVDEQTFEKKDCYEKIMSDLTESILQTAVKLKTLSDESV
ncbi:MAG: N-formylglutamate amidohydrolase [Alphaproteobacteria bacterium]|nr:N-formylglutamate amidohydrolase [Alphaproteobacteria bacterium]